MKIIHHISFVNQPAHIEILDKNSIVINDFYGNISVYKLYNNKLKLLKKIPGLYITHHDSTYITNHKGQLYTINVLENTLFIRKSIPHGIIRLYSNHLTYRNENNLTIEGKL